VIGERTLGVLRDIIGDSDGGAGLGNGGVVRGANETLLDAVCGIASNAPWGKRVIRARRRAC
jgi:hypothetical protein